MTYCIGIALEDQAILIADSLITSSQPPSSSQTTLGQAQEQDPQGFYVEESGMKIHRLSEDCAAAFAGDVDVAMAILRCLLDSNANAANLPQNLKIAATSVGPFHKDQYVELIFAVTNGEKHCIGKWDTNSETLRLEPGISWTGSGGEFVSRNVPSLLVKSSYEFEVSDASRLAILVSIAQCFFFWHSQMNDGIGGVFYGASVNGSGFQWCPDMMYFPIAPDRMIRPIATSHLCDGIAVASSYSNQKKFIGTNLFEGALPSQDRLRQLDKSVESDSIDRVVFFNETEERIAFLDKTCWSGELPYSKSTNSDGLDQLGWKNELKDFIFPSNLNNGLKRPFMITNLYEVK